MTDFDDPLIPKESAHWIAISCPVEQLGRVQHRLVAADLTVRTVRGGASRTTQALFDQFAAAFQFPWYFSSVWASFDECMADLDWLDVRAGLGIVVSDAQNLLEDDSASLKDFITTINYAASEWFETSEEGQGSDRPPLPLAVVLQWPEDRAEADVGRWRQAGLELPEPIRLDS